MEKVQGGVARGGRGECAARLRPGIEPRTPDYKSGALPIKLTELGPGGVAPCHTDGTEDKPYPEKRKRLRCAAERVDPAGPVLQERAGAQGGQQANDV